jgi:AhpD family alkylhydroperoxidase
MGKDWRAFSKDVDARSAALFNANRETMRVFREQVGEVSKDGALDHRTKELIALGIAITVRCEGCISFHTRTVIKYGPSQEEVVETIGVAIELGGGPSSIFGAEVLEAYDQLSG